MEKIQKKIDRWRILARELIATGSAAFVVDSNNTWHWCYVLGEDENSITFKNFYGDNTHTEQNKLWGEIFNLKKYINIKDRRKV